MLSLTVDWFSFTVKNSRLSVFEFWQDNFLDKLGELTDLDHGARGYKNMSVALAGAKVYYSPSDGTDHFHIELPGSACACLLPSHFQDLLLQKKVGNELGELKMRITRLDLAIDYGDFTVADFWEKVSQNEVNTKASRASFQYI